MKTMSCRQLGGACDEKFHAETFEEMAKLSKRHGLEMFEKKDEEHMKAMRAMSELMSSPDAMQKWMAEKKREFDSMPRD